ncbi:MAG: DNA-processing protein DprA [Candidatus Omnitrophota bacterium]
MTPDEIAILQMVMTPGLGGRSLERILTKIQRENLSPADFLSLSPQAMALEYALKPEIVRVLHELLAQAQSMAQRLEEHRIKMLIKGRAEYPHRLQSRGKDAPAAVFARGNELLFPQSAIGFTGPRRPTPQGAKAANRYAARLSQIGANIVSGYADGVDLSAHQGALESGGTTTLVLAEGILQFRIKKEIAPYLREGNHLVVSEFSPNSAWLAGCAMQRNRTICALSQAVIAVEPGVKGGAYATAQAALRLKRPLFVIGDADRKSGSEGIRYFLDHGADLLPYGDEDGAVIDSILEALSKKEISAAAEEQPLLFD